MFIIWGWYHFRQRNLRVRSRPCPACRQVRLLGSFDCFEWAHLYGIPLIPSGRKHVVRCGACSRFWRVDAKAWLERQQRAQREADGLALDASAEAQMVTLRDLTEAELDEQAEKLARRLETDFNERQDVKAQLAGWYRYVGQAVKAERLLAELRASAPPEPEPTEDTDAGRRALAATAVAAKDFGLAKKRLLSIEKHEHQPDFVLLFNTAEQLRAAGREHDAYPLYSRLFAAFPKEAVRHYGAVTATRRLEKKLGIGTTVIPKGMGSRRDTVIGAGIAALCVLVFAGLELWVREHQKLYLLNSTGSAARLRLAGQELTLEPYSHSELPLPEGHYDVSVELLNGARWQTPIELENNVWQRVTGTHAFVFDVLGATAFEVQEVWYRSQQDSGRDPDPTVYFGAEFTAFRGIDYAFAEPPQSLSLKQGTAERRTVLYCSHSDPLKLLKWAADPGTPLAPVLSGDARLYAEGLIRGGFHAPALIDAYRELCRAKGCDEQASAFLAKEGVSNE